MDTRIAQMALHVSAPLPAARGQVRSAGNVRPWDIAAWSPRCKLGRPRMRALESDAVCSCDDLREATFQLSHPNFGWWKSDSEYPGGGPYEDHEPWYL